MSDAPAKDRPVQDRPVQDRPVQDLTYEQARDELVAVVARLETGGETLEGSLALWERGEALAARCQDWLDGARQRLDAVRNAPGTATATTSQLPPGAARPPGAPGAPTDEDEGEELR